MKVEFKTLEDLDTLVNVAGTNMAMARYIIAVAFSPQHPDPAKTTLLRPETNDTQGKINKDQIQKIVLSGIGFIVLIYVYFTFFLGPLNKRPRHRGSDHGRSAGQSSAPRKPTWPRPRNLDRKPAVATARFAALKRS